MADLAAARLNMVESQVRTQEQGLAVRAYVPAFLKITARDIEQWADGNLNARATLPVLLRKLVQEPLDPWNLNFPS